MSRVLIESRGVGVGSAPEDIEPLIARAVPTLLEACLLSINCMIRAKVRLVFVISNCNKYAKEIAPVVIGGALGLAFDSHNLIRNAGRLAVCIIICTFAGSLKRCRMS